MREEHRSSPWDPIILVQHSAVRVGHAHRPDGIGTAVGISVLDLRCCAHVHSPRMRLVFCDGLRERVVSDLHIIDNISCSDCRIVIARHVLRQVSNFVADGDP